jgi:hypothetical protein
MGVLNNGPAIGVKSFICGTKLSRLLASGMYSQTAWALTGHRLETGEAALTCTMPAQTVAILPVTTMAFLRTVRRATELELTAMQCGRLSVEALHREQLAQRADRRLTDAELDRLVEREGNRLLAAIERHTRPRSNGAATNGRAAANDNDNGNGGVALPVQLSL